MKEIILPLCIVTLWLIIVLQAIYIQRLKRRKVAPAAVDPPVNLQIVEVSQADIGPNDVIVLTSPGLLSDSTANRIRTYLEETWPGRKSIVLCDGLKLSVLHETPKPDPVP